MPPGEDRWPIGERERLVRAAQEEERRLRRAWELLEVDILHPCAVFELDRLLRPGEGYSTAVDEARAFLRQWEARRNPQRPAAEAKRAKKDAQAERIAAEWPRAEAHLRDRYQGRQPTRGAIASKVAENLSINERTVRRYAPK